MKKEHKCELPVNKSLVYDMIRLIIIEMIMKTIVKVIDAICLAVSLQ